MKPENSVELRPSGTIIGRHFNEERFTTDTRNGWCYAIVALALGMMKIEVMVPEQEFVL